MNKEQLNEANYNYWFHRAESYAEINRQELDGLQRNAWKQLIEQRIYNAFPNKLKREITILDAGAGPGFFSIILAEAGYRVTAIDMTDSMLSEARKNAGKLSSSITFLQMDAQELSFKDNYFDVVVSRNLTWVLPMPEKAYSEWQRVLKPGGILMVFDANWYHYLYDEEKRRAYEQDRANVKARSMDDHYLCTNIEAMEEIARSVPLSRKQRPQWDRQILEQMGMCRIRFKEDINNMVLSETEKINYASSPYFMVEARKGERGA